jgi:hypothetical protein
MGKLFEQFAGELEKLNGELSGLTSRLKALTDRAETVLRQSKRNMPVRDAAFEADFRAVGEELIGLTNRLEDFWKKAGDAVRHCPLKDSAEGSDMAIREFSSRAREANRLVSEFSATFSYIQSRCKGLTMRLNWFVFDTNIEILAKLNPKILFAMREISKVVDESSGAQRSKPHEPPLRDGGCCDGGK